METFSAGGVVLNKLGQVLVVSQHGNSWSLPKGHIDPGEDARTAALREIREESGLTKLSYIKDLGSYQRHRIGLQDAEDKSVIKNIEFFLYTTEEQELIPEDPDNPEARWVDIGEVSNLLTHQADKDFFKSCCGKFSNAIKQ